MTCGVRSALVTAFLAIAAMPAGAEPFHEGVIASTGKDGAETVAFAFVNCNGALMFDFVKDPKLNKIQRRSDGSLRVKFNRNKTEITIYEDGRFKTKKGEIRHWRLLRDSELLGPLAKRWTKAKQKCG